MRAREAADAVETQFGTREAMIKAKLLGLQTKMNTLSSSFTEHSALVEKNIDETADVVKSTKVRIANVFDPTIEKWFKDAQDVKTNLMDEVFAGRDYAEESGSKSLTMQNDLRLDASTLKRNSSIAHHSRLADIDALRTKFGRTLS